jgi:hypothetical protein
MAAWKAKKLEQGAWMDGRDHASIEGSLKLQYGRNWCAEDYMDLIPEFPDFTSDETRRASTYTPLYGEPVPLGRMLVSEICAQHANLKNRKPSDWNDAWIQAFEQELDYRATRHSYETSPTADKIGG